MEISERMSFSSFEDLYNSGKIEFPNQSLGIEPKPEKLSQKPEDIFVGEIISQDSEIIASIKNTLENLAEHNIALPFVHFTPDELVGTDGGVVGKTDNLEDITQNGLKKMHTNVAGFTSPESRLVNDPAIFVEKPEYFIKDYLRMIKHYRHHGARLNHSTNNPDHPDAVSGVPAIVLIKGNLPVVHGTDYQDHYILTDGAKSEDIIGTIKNAPNQNSPDDISASIRILLSTLKDLITEERG
ncbi:hypothetical protein FACS189431_1670 [Alphaproteobacteria bacterium]|nr:hypothetical protein FACS189431_1670 [Alphaproteobacteria bacterium]